MSFLQNNCTLIIGIFIYLLCFFIGYLGDKRMKNKTKNDKIIFYEKSQGTKSFELSGEETINNIF